MGKILQFPETRRIQVNLHEHRDNLKALYDALKQCYEHIEEIEKRIQMSEQSYDLAFAQYAKARGLDNVEVEYFEWVSFSNIDDKIFNISCENFAKGAYFAHITSNTKNIKKLIVIK